MGGRLPKLGMSSMGSGSATRELATAAAAAAAIARWDGGGGGGNLDLRYSTHSLSSRPYGRNFSITPCSSLYARARKLPSLLAAGESIRLLESLALIWKRMRL